MRLEYALLIILALFYYLYVYKEDKKRKDNIKYIKENLKIGSRVITKSDIIGIITQMNDFSCVIKTGTEDKFSYLEIKKYSIKEILEEL
ncbi:MAG: preprotein translocase subunit YajC [Tissierellia bacterium]|nr:preprotein translocase subunit YajC [Tissierellia bacterium]